MQYLVNRRPQEREQCAAGGDSLHGFQRVDVSRCVDFNFDGL
jgi:hypothetical protein